MIRKLLIGAAVALVAAALGVWLIYIPSQMVYAVRVPLGADPSSVGLAYEDVAFPSAGGTPLLRAWWIPASHPRGVVIFVHGGNGNRRELYTGGLEIDRFLVDAGYSVLAPDLRNHGLSGTARGGKITLGIDESRDVRGAIDYANRRAPGLAVALFGTSMGGAASIFAAADDSRVTRLVLLDPLLDAPSTEAGALGATLPLPRVLIGPIRWSADTFFAADVARRDALATALTLRQPILLISDDRDPVCLPQFAHALAAGNRHVRLWTSVDPDRQVGGWGYHTGAFKLHPHEVETLVARFLAGTP